MDAQEPAEAIDGRGGRYSLWPRGSIWRKWDLHFHTPSSYDYGNKSITDEGIVNALKAAGIAVVAITDHHTIDPARIRHLQQLAGEDLTIFPGIELRTELGGKESIHINGIFSQDADISHIWTKLQGGLSLTPADVKAKGDDRVYVQFTKAASLIHELNGLVCVHAGHKSNSIENISNAHAFKQAVKEDLAKSCVDIMEIARLSDADDYEKIVFLSINRWFPLVICSDNHDVNHYELRAANWVRADPTFEGLRQIINEPGSRVYRGDLPPVLQRVAQNKTKYIDHVTIKKIADSKLPETWFDCSVPLNPGLVAIIGNKGSGKSALSDVIGLLGETRHGDSFSFLNPDKFRQPKNNKARHFHASVTWESGLTTLKSLDAQIDENAVETIKYIPQNYLETICNELRGGESRFDEELKAVIFSHVGPAERLGAESLDGIIEYKTQETYEAIGLLRKELSDINKEVAAFEEMLSASFKKTLQAQLAEKQRELDAHDAGRPVPISKPDLDAGKQSEMAALGGEIETTQAELVALREDRDKLLEEQKLLARRAAVAVKLISKIDNFKKQHQVFIGDAAAEFRELGLIIDSVIQVAINTDEITTIHKAATDRATEIRAALEPTTANSLAARIAQKELSLAATRAKLDAPNREYQNYLVAEADWTGRRAKIIGDKDTVGTYTYFQAHLKELDEIPARLTAATERRTAKATEIYNAIESLVTLYKTLYRPLQDFIEHHPLAQKGLQLDFKVSIVEAGFEAGFFDLISQAKKGSFCGIEEGRQVLKALAEKTEWNASESVLSFLNQILDHLSRDYRQPKRPQISLPEQLKKEDLGHRALRFSFLLWLSQAQIPSPMGRPRS